jgi:NADH-quinone oxidoreductase subunit E
MTNFKFTEENLKEFERLKTRYPNTNSLMLPALWMVQEQEGWVSTDSIVYVANMLGKSPIEVYEFATFYTMFNLKPIGTHHIELCKTLSCMLCGSREIKAYIKEKIGIEPGQTSEDGLFHLTEVECLGACGGAPMFALDGNYHENLTNERVDQLIEECRK